MFDAFISYSRQSDLEVPEAFQNWLERFAKPWWRRRSIRVFRDQTNLTVSPNGWAAISEALTNSTWMILFLDPYAAESKWVNREVRLWLGDDLAGERNDTDLSVPLESVDRSKLNRLILVVKAGKLHWNDAKSDFDWRTTDCVPKCLSGVFLQEPFWGDLRDISHDSANALDRSNPDFIGLVAKVSAKIRNLELSDVIGEEARRHKQTMRTALLALLSLTTLALLLSVVALIAVFSARSADDQRVIAVALSNAAQSRAEVLSNPGELAAAARVATASFESLKAVSDSPSVPAWYRDTVLRFDELLPGFIPQLAQGVARYELPPVSPAHTILHEANALLPLSVQSFDSSFESDATLLGIVDQKGVIVGERASNTVEIWDLETSEVRTVRFATPTRRVNGQLNLVHSGNGKWVATEDSRSGEVVVAEVLTGEQYLRFDPVPYLEDVASRRVEISETESGGPVVENFIVSSGGGASALAGITMNELGDQLVIVSEDGASALLSLNFDSRDVHRVSSMTLEPAGVSDLMRMQFWQMSPDGEYLVASPSSHDIGQAPLFIWDTNTGKESKASRIFSGSVKVVSFSPDSELLAVGTNDGEILVFDYETGLPRSSLRVTGQVDSIAVGTGLSEGLVAVGTGSYVSIFDLSLRLEVARIPLAGAVQGIAWLDDRLELATGSFSGNVEGPAVRIWDLTYARRLVSSRMQTPYSVDAIAVDERNLVAIGWPASLYNWDLETTELLYQHRHEGISRKAIALNSAENAVALVSMLDNTIAQFLDLNTNVLTPIAGLGYGSTALSDGSPFLAEAAFSADGLRMARLIKSQEGDPCTLEIWNLPQMSILKKTSCHTQTDDVVLSADGSFVAWSVKGDKPHLNILNLTQDTVPLAVPVELEQRATVSKQIAFSPDGSQIIVAEGKPFLFSM